MASTSPPARIVIEDVSPLVDGGRFPVKRVVDEPVVVEAAIYADGHDRLWCVVAHQPPGSSKWTPVAMVQSEPGLDRWRATFTPRAEGVHKFRIQAWIDAFGSWVDATSRKLDAGLDVASELLEGAAILEALAARAPKADQPGLRAAADALRDGDTTPMTDRGGDDRPSATELAHRALKAKDASTSKPVDIDVERERALFSSWYELFPRSWGRKPGVHGTFADVEDQLDYVADMGFDVLYLPPIHPIGTSFRKGPNNAETCGPKDPGSPWAIGSSEGGHTAVHPQLGSLDDFRSLVRACDANGIEVALDLALQCSPDHPWVTEHPEWFRHRPDGSIQYAENPPKIYQDIYPLDFEGEAWRSLWDACLDLFLFWASQGVRIFRIDNPHTKPFAFWEWLLAEVRTRYPETLFLSEAFTRPKIMQRLATIGFTLSYNYFPWRASKGELIDYFVELSSSPTREFFRSSSWTNTPDILTWQLMDAPRAVFASRVFLAATLSASYGIYGPAFELGDNHPAGNGKEEYLDSEKYQLRSWDRLDPDSLRDLISDLNRMRVENRALHTQRTLRFHGVDNDELVCFSKTAHSGPSTAPDDHHGATVLVVANLSAGEQRGMVELDLGALGVDHERPYDVHDLVTDLRFTWTGNRNYVELHPDVQPGHLFRVTQS